MVALGVLRVGSPLYEDGLWISGVAVEEDEGALGVFADPKREAKVLLELVGLLEEIGGYESHPPPHKLAPQVKAAPPM